MSHPSAADLIEGVLGGNRASLARAITLTESSRSDHRDLALAVLDGLLPATGRSRRIGISGTPGVGKSTFIEAFGLDLIDNGFRVAVLAVDPSSQSTGGSILGDKTRMTDLNRSDRVFIRPSPSKGTLGGVTARSREAVLLCEAAGHDVVIVETVGVGQSETAVAEITDLFVLLLAPGGGDDLQGIKRGVMELADLIVVNKADGDRRAEAERTAGSYREALHLVRPKWSGPTEVVTTSALDRQRMAETSQRIIDAWERREELGINATLRRHQSEQALSGSIVEAVLARLEHDPTLLAERTQLSELVARQELSVSSAAQRLASNLFESIPPTT